MKLVHPEFNYQIEFRENIVNLIVIEDKKVFREYVGELYSQCMELNDSGRFVLSNEEKEIKLSKKVEIILDFYSLDINNKKIITKVYNKLKEISTEEDMYVETGKINSEIVRYVDKIVDISDYPLEFSIDIDIVDLFKMASVKFLKDYTSELDRICDYINVVNEITGKDIFIFVNFRDFFELDELEEFYKFITYKKIFLIMIENEINDVCNEFEKIFVLDEDLCEIY
ncbi:MAG: type II-A CRISPR-associated protein Csn2 [Peptacetobacter hiranonis]|nr:type II-A CRISPR-associated protein Csn2 [Peptacetobacter hiranonis]